MSQLFAEDEVELQSLVKQFLRSISDKISSAPSPECAEEILLHLEETDKDFHNYEFVKYLRQYVENALGSVVEEETNNLTREDGQHAIGSGHDTLIHAVTQRTRDSAEYQQMIHTLKNTMITVVESLKNKFEDDQLRKEEMHHEKQHRQSNIQFTDNCSDSGSSFSQSYGFFRQEQLQVLAEKLDSNKPKEVRWEALKVLCRAPTSDVLSCESWSSLRRNLCVALSEPDPDLSDNALRFFAKSLSSSPLNVTREIYTSLAKSVASSFLSHKLSFPSGSATIDINRPEISRLLKQIRLMNDFQKEVTNFWIRHPEKYMEEVIESTFSLLSYHHEHGSPGTERVLEPVHLLALLDVKATWFKKWMHGYYSRAVILRLLERKYKSVAVAALQQCIKYNESCERFTNETTESGEQRSIGLVQRSVYSGKELEYCCFVHSLCVLGKLVIYTNGRKLFPIKIRKYKDPVTLTDLIVILLNIMFKHPRPLDRDCSHTGSDVVSPSTLVMEVLWMLCEQTEWAAECLYQTPVIEKLLAPVIALLNGQKAELKSPAATLSLIADILARIANTDRGLALFLFEKNLAAAHSERTFAAHIIVQFTQRLLDKELPSLCESDMPHSLCGAFILVCRQMYNTCEGLQVLRPYGLHKALAAAWKKTSTLSERVQTPVPGGDAGSSTQELQNMLIWEETLLDSLLNFAATPKGLLLLQQTGAINECVSYMFSRFTKKLQVSSCEKFGYGVMVTQVAATAPGVVALHSSGFIRALVLELWSVLECSGDNIRVVRPKPTPIDPIDRSCLKSFLYLVNLLSSSQSVWELLGRQPLANKSEYTLREMPTSIPDLIDRLIAMNSDVKIHSLFHYEESHTFGLRLLNVLCCNLDSFLLLESQYNICSMLLQSQMGNVTDPDSSEGNIIIDSLSVERNHVLVRVSVVGGPSERRLPPRDLQEGEGEHPYPWPWFSCYPVPRCYTLDPPDILHTSPDSEISAFLSSWKDPKNDGSWMEACRTLYCKVMASKPSVLTGKVLADLLEKVVAHLSNSASECFFSPARYKAEEKTVKNAVLSSVEQLGINTCLKYGIYLRLLKEEAANDLALLMKHVKIFLSAQRVKTSSELITHQEGYPGHDWLASTVFLIMAGNIEKSLCLLVSLSSLLTSAFIWPARIHASIHFPKEVAESGIPPVYWCTAHYVEMLLKAEVPLVHSAFKMSGFTPSQMCLHWLIQCFWNYLDWTEICHYICTCVVMGPDYQVYMCVAIFKHLQPDILQRTQSQELQVFLKEEPIQGFSFTNHLEFMGVLEHKYRDIVLADMKMI
ncbi:protein broad-minded isoform X1 [Oreochromis niloticus]|uniref:Protein broad-minded n=1 Tax=Oreochromis niloticus TaxID=8128 RepID=I3KPM3_ORENI|nr:protein broad-minded isoform X1 [Oreochromis niloticus]XP_013120437.1 protein broad-minded isoform X1 [Oreochromis niloticus]XP_013120438.1 protein broad-minded isoform X1 [Oreochromis niloticus]XP_013120439.1 protein broad-minded isoform X1 [Oreochromis niloticus]XP_013120440.1 protein broad-minded isoform X1 [Oreochromis niloticus]